MIKDNKTNIFKVEYAISKDQEKDSKYFEIFDDIICIREFLDDIMNIPISDKKLLIQINKFRKFTNKKSKEIKRKLKLIN